MPTPPDTTKAPVVVDTVADVALIIIEELLIERAKYPTLLVSGPAP